jgi:hypothetical protein
LIRNLRIFPTSIKLFEGLNSGRRCQRPQRDEKAGQLYDVGGNVKDTTGRLKQDSPLPFLLDLSANVMALPLGFHRAHLSLREQRKQITTK